ncbi:MAG: dihydroorotase [Thermosediminibacterales bacterium]|nr:dihydroorotase [Thermosediminibacterales bacterium]MDK2835300.1 dihydroorotase [Thermosediminibacterales bacterium]
MPVFDILLKGGTLIDPSQGISMEADVGIIVPNIAQIIKPGESSIIYKECIDVSGSVVVPGLIDFHSHIFEGGMSIAVDPEHLIRQGVVATVDGGSVGYPSFSYFRKKIMMNSRVWTNAVINLSGFGILMLHESEFARPGFIDEKELARTIEIHNDVVLGIKLRFSKQQVGENGLDILQRAKKIARDLDVRLFVHSTDPPIPYPKLLNELDSGDVLLHMYHGRGFKLLNSEGKVWEEAWEAKKRGVIFDCAHGMSHFNFDVARKAIEQGFLPDIVSSDMTSLGLCRPNFCELPTVISELIALGMKFEDVLLRCTKNPAELMKGIKSGIKVGFPANLTVLKTEERNIEFYDSEGQIMKANKLIVPQLTMIQGEVVYKKDSSTIIC